MLDKLSDFVIKLLIKLLISIKLARCNKSFKLASGLLTTVNYVQFTN